MAGKSGFFWPHTANTPGNTGVSRGVARDLMKMNGYLAANLDAADPPAITVPEALALPITGAGRIGHVGRRAVIVVALRRIVVARTVIIAGAVIAVLRGDRAANDGAADQAGRDARGNAALGVSGGGGRNG